MENYDVSIVIVFNNIDKLNTALQYINEQSIINDCEIISLDNRNNNYSSMTLAYNEALQKAKGNVVIFMHQDINLLDKSILCIWRDFIKENPKSIVGAAGISKVDHKTHSDIFEGENMIKRAKPLNGPFEEAITLDECMFGSTKKHLEQMKFDTEYCQGWNLYGVEICYRNILDNNSNYIISSNLQHLSLGNINKSFEKDLYNLIKKYKGKLSKIETPCVKIDCNYLSYIKYVLRHRKIAILNFLGF